jgi:hypothetical protein
MNLQESIRRILREERKLSGSLIRRLNSLDYEVERGLNGPFSGSNICIFFKSDVEFFESVMENSIDVMYYKHFSRMDDNSGEWAHEYLDMVDYIRKKHKNKIIKHYDDNCRSGSIPLKESIRRVLREDTDEYRENVRVKISDIQPTNRDGQSIEDAIINVKDGLTSYSQDPPFLLKRGDKYEILDGFHRIAQKILDGKKYVTSDVMIKESIRRVLREEKLHATPQELIKNLPNELKELLFKQWDAKQNPEWHPEGNTLKHIIVVIKRAYHHYPDDPNMVMAALFHDLGKIDTYKINPKTNQPTAYGHEDKSTDYVEKFKDWIESFEGMNVEEIKYLVKNHMKVKPSTWDQMKDKKKEPIMSHPAFDKLMGFTDKLDGGGTDLKESIKKALKEETNKNDIKSILFNILNQSEYVQKFDYVWSPNLSVGSPIMFINDLSERDFFDNKINIFDLISEYWPYGKKDYEDWKDLYYGLVYGYVIKDKNSDTKILVQVIRFDDGFKIYLNPNYKKEIEGDKIFIDDEMINVFTSGENTYSDNDFTFLGIELEDKIKTINDMKNIFNYLDALI